VVDLTWNGPDAVTKHKHSKSLAKIIQQTNNKHSKSLVVKMTANYI